ncbi:beta-glucanase [Cellulosilyticum ruminicola]
MKKYGILIGLGFMLVGCQNINSVQETQSVQVDMAISDGDKDIKKLDKVADFENEFEIYDDTLMEKANGWSNGSMFDCTWRESNVQFNNGKMQLSINDDGEGASPKWSGGEYRTRKFFHYGMYEVCMKPIKNIGVVSSFFTYTGPSDNNPWDEIDIEFLGKDTTKVQFNYFTNGVGEHEYLYDLGFDASEGFHEYGFEWQPEAITWYVDGKPVYTATDNIPQTPSKLMMNTWPGTGVDSWLGHFEGSVPLTAEYEWMKIKEYINK